MNYLRAIILYVVILFSLLQSWLLVTTLAVLVFSLFYHTAFLIPLAILIDGYFGHFYTMPVLSVCAVVWSVGVESMKPALANLRNI